MKKLIHYTSCFQSTLSSLLEPFSGKSCMILISGGSILPLLSNKKYAFYNTKDWTFLLSDERVTNKSEDINYNQANYYLKENFTEFKLLDLRKIENIEDYYFDIAILGVGDDGHIMSLFPNHHLDDGFIVKVSDAPKMPKERISIGINVVNTRVKKLVFMIPPKDKVKEVEGPHKSIDENIFIDYDIYLDISKRVE